MSTKAKIRIKTQAEVAIMRKAGSILASIIEELKCSLKDGMTTLDIDHAAESLIARHNVKPAFKGYRGFPGCACVSVNEEVVHGIPGKKVVKQGDIISVDVGIIYNGYYSDTAFTAGIGKIDSKVQALLDVTQTALAKGIDQVKPGNRLSDISHAIQTYVDNKKLGIVRDFVGHGIGVMLHEDPEIPNYGPPNQGPVLEEGMVFAIEPMVNLGTYKTKIIEDGWTVVTEDGQPSAHFEHTVAVTSSGFEILTKVN